MDLARNNPSGLRKDEALAIDEVAKLWRCLGQSDSPVVYDIGARFGEVSLRLAQQLSLRHVYAFEPQSHLNAALRESFQNKNFNYEIVNRACGSSSGQQTFYRNSDEGTSSLLRPTAELLSRSSNYDCVDSFETPVVSLDDFVSEGNYPPDIIKLDAQGFDLEVIKGGAGIFHLGYPKILLVEAYIAQAYIGAPDFFDIGLHLREYGYRLFQIPRTIATSNGGLYFLDAIFLSAAGFQMLNSN